MLKKSRKIKNTISINSKVGRNINRTIVLNFIREQQPISRVRISELTGLNKSTVSSIVNSLIEEDLVSEHVDRNQEIGRNPLNLSVKKRINHVGAIYFNSVKTELAIADVDGDIIAKEEMKTESQQPVEFIRRCLEHLKLLQMRAHALRLRGVGITVAGIVDSAHAKVVFAPNLGWKDLELGSLVQSFFGENITVKVENDAKASALAELTLGKNRITPRNFVFLSVGTGIGAGIVVDDHILSGSSHAAGEFGHMTVVEGGEPCSCGNHGCWELYASDRAMIRRYAASKGIAGERVAKLFPEDVIIAANMQDADAIRALKATAIDLGVGIANIIRSFDPEYIIIGGAITQVWELIYPDLVETVNKRGFFGHARNTTILPTSLAGNPPLLGAAALSIREIFTDYRIAL